MAEAIQEVEKEVVLENDDVIITLTSKGANVKEVQLKKHLTFDKSRCVKISEPNFGIWRTFDDS